MFGKFKGFKTLVDNISKLNIKTLKSDNIGEYTSNELENISKYVSIKRELITPYNQQHNGVPERKNQTIVEAMENMIHDQDLPMHLWDEATRTTIYNNICTKHNIP